MPQQIASSRSVDLHHYIVRANRTGNVELLSTRAPCVCMCVCVRARVGGHVRMLLHGGAHQTHALCLVYLRAPLELHDQVPGLRVTQKEKGATLRRERHGEQVSTKFALFLAALQLYVLEYSCVIQICLRDTLRRFN